MNHLVDLTMSFVDNCQRHTCLKSLMNEFSVAIGEFGFNHFMMTRLPALGEDAEPYVIAQTWPKAWLDRYREGKYFWHDPVSAYALTRARPFSWGEARKGSRATKLTRQIASEASSLGLLDGLGFPMGDPSSVQAVVSLASDHQIDLDPFSRQMLHLLCINAELRAVEIYDAVSVKFGALTEREKEVLRWIANGKSLIDTGQIMTLTERTVRDHLASTRQKLNATTTTHAVARALKSRQIIL